MQALFGAYWSKVYLLMVVSIVAASFLIRRFPLFANWIESVNVSKVSVSIILIGVLQFAFYLLMPNYSDYGEPTIALLAANLLNGGTVYGDWNSHGSLVGSNYGPNIILIQSAFIWMLPTIFGSKLPGVLFAVAALIMISRATIRYRRDAAWFYPACLVVMLSSNLHYWFWNRPDSVLIGLVACCALCADRLREERMIMVVALMAAISINLKLFAPLYFLPFFAASAVSLGLTSKFAKSFVLGAAGFVVGSSLPFLLFSSFDIKPYLANIFMMHKQGFLASQALCSFGYAAAIFSPVFIGLRRHRLSTADKATLYTSIISVIIVSVLAGKPGAGTPYMMPFAPLAVYLMAKVQPDTTSSTERSTPALIFIVLLVFSLPIWAYSFYQIGKQLPRYAEQDVLKSELRDLFLRFPNAEYGPRGYNDPTGFYRVEKAFAAQTTKFDYINYADQRLAGVPGEVADRLFDHCSISTWLFSANGDDKLSTNVYGPELFTDQTRRQFNAAYARVYKSENFEAWSCAKKATLNVNRPQ